MGDPLGHRPERLHAVEATAPDHDQFSGLGRREKGGDGVVVRHARARDPPSGRPRSRRRRLPSYATTARRCDPKRPARCCAASYARREDGEPSTPTTIVRGGWPPKPRATSTDVGELCTTSVVVEPTSRPWARPCPRAPTATSVALRRSASASSASHGRPRTATSCAASPSGSSRRVLVTASCAARRNGSMSVR